MKHSHIPHDEPDDDVIDDIAIVCFALVGMGALILAPVGVVILTYLAMTAGH